MHINFVFILYYFFAHSKYARKVFKIYHKYHSENFFKYTKNEMFCLLKMPSTNYKTATRTIFNFLFYFGFC
uniref:Putative secreted protein n=1 Tax=Ixodes ricinus TaxID=34613 RepID=A0A6B0U1S9_IXORI